MRAILEFWFTVVLLIAVAFIGVFILGPIVFVIVAGPFYISKWLGHSPDWGFIAIGIYAFAFLNFYIANREDW